MKQNLSLFKATNPITHQNQNHFRTYQYDYQLEWVPSNPITHQNQNNFGAYQYDYQLEWVPCVHARSTHVYSLAGPTSESRRVLRD